MTQDSGKILNENIVQMFHLILDQFISRQIKANYTSPLLLTISLMHIAILQLTIMKKSFNRMKVNKGAHFLLYLYKMLEI